MKKRYLGILAGLILCLCVTACGKNSEKTEGKDTIKDAVLMAVGDETVSGQEAMVYLYLLRQQYEVGMGEGVWSYSLGEEMTIEDYAKEAVISNLTQLKVICQQAVSEGITLDEGEAYEAQRAARRLLENATEEDKERFRLEEAVIAKAYEDNVLAAKFFDAATAEVNTNISNEDARQITVQYVYVSTEGMIEAQKEEKKEKAKKLLKEAKKATSFLSFAASNSDSEETQITFGNADMPEDFGQAAMELKTGELSSVIEGEKGYYILYCITDYNEDATLAKKEAMIEEERDRLFREKYAEWTEDYKVVISEALWDEMRMR